MNYFEFIGYATCVIFSGISSYRLARLVFDTFMLLLAIGKFKRQVRDAFIDSITRSPFYAKEVEDFEFTITSPRLKKVQAEKLAGIASQIIGQVYRQYSIKIVRA